MTDPLCSCHTPLRWFLSKRPLVFALETVLALAIAVAGAWLAAKAGHKLNAKFNGDIRAGYADDRAAEAQQRSAAAMERVAEILDRAYAKPKCPAMTFDQELDVIATLGENK